MAMHNGARGPRICKVLCLGLGLAALLGCILPDEVFVAPYLHGGARAPAVARRAEEDRYVVYEEDNNPEAAARVARERGNKGITNSMRERLIAEATSAGTEDQVATSGFGNPYLFASVIFVVLGVASYFALGLDKIDLNGPASKMSDAEIERKYMDIAQSMNGNQ
mmetsp:Transcript_137166/g.438639  ORF Transcript_137166/g.438639 Transcript_137166/m.438639 type:complete len:165 (-) Transcript_137166:144-638(-)